jgi:hypothetical protein
LRPRDGTFPGEALGLAFARAAYSAKALFASLDPALEARGLSFSHATRKAVMLITINPVARRNSFRTSNNSFGELAM